MKNNIVAVSYENLLQATIHFYMKHSAYLAIIAILVIIILAQRSCYNKPGQTVTKVDTVLIKTTDTLLPYTPRITVFEPGHIPTPTAYVPAVTDTLYVFEKIFQPIDTNAILKDYYARLYYDDTIQTSYGAMRVMDSVSKNRITWRKVTTDFTIPEITKTVIHERPPTAEIFVGISGIGSKTTPLIGAGPSVMLITKNRKAFEVGALFTRGQLMYQASAKFKL